MSHISPDFDTKRLQLIREMLPKASRIAYLGLSGDWNSEGMMATRITAKEMGLTIVFVEVQMPRLQDALQRLKRKRPDAILVGGNPPFFVHRKLIADFAAKSRVADFHRYHQAVEVGALASYGRYAGRAGGAIRARHQPQDRQGPRPHHPALAALAGGSGA